MPRVDGVFLTANPLYLIQQGSVADVPIISGMSLVDASPLSIFHLTERSVDRELRRRRNSLFIGDHQHYVRDTRIHDGDLDDSSLCSP